MTQTRFYRNRINPDELSSTYAKEKVKSINSARNNSYDLNLIKNRNSCKNMKKTNFKVAHSFSNLDDILNNTYNSNNNNNMTKSKKNITELNNKIYNDILYINNINNLNSNNNNKICKRLNTYRTTCSLKKGKTYSNKQKLFKINDYNNNINNNDILNNFLKNNNHNYHNNIEKYLSEYKSYISSSSSIHKNNFPNLSLKAFNNNNSMKHLNNDNLCDNCLKIKLFNEKICFNKNKLKNK